MAARQRSKKAAAAKATKKTGDIRRDIAVQHPDIFPKVAASAERRIFAGMKFNPDVLFAKIAAAVLRANDETISSHERETAMSDARREFDDALAKSRSFGREVDRIYREEIGKAYGSKRKSVPAHPTATDQRRADRFRELTAKGKVHAQALDAMVIEESPDPNHPISQQAIRGSLRNMGIAVNTRSRLGRNKQDRKAEG